MDYQELLKKYDELYDKYQKLKSENDELKKQLGLNRADLDDSNHVPSVMTYVGVEDYKTIFLVDKNSSKEDKIALYKSLFRGRDDVIAKLWNNGKGYSPYCYNEWVIGICPKKHNSRFKCTKCDNQNFAFLDNVNIEKHLLGKHFVGIYPITKDDTCYFVAIDLDKADWRRVAASIIKVSKDNNMHVYPEISKSGNGVHLWFFFENAMKASMARAFASEILTETMEFDKNLGMDSYDRLFPSQDYLQKDGFGNLIALPLNLNYRKRGVNQFVDDKLNIVKDQWKYLSQVRKLTEEDIKNYLKLRSGDKFESDNEFVKRQFVKMQTDGRQLKSTDFTGAIVIKLSSGIVLEKAQLSARAINYLRKISSFANPEFFKKQRMRMSTYNTPRYIKVFDEYEESIWLPRGVFEQIEELLEKLGVDYIVEDYRQVGEKVKIEFKAVLRVDQKIALDRLRSYDNGVLSAPTGFGKTVIGAALIAEKEVNTLVLVHTRQLADQWQERLEEFLDTPEYNPNEKMNKRGRKKQYRRIGLLGGGKNRLTGNVDIAIMQSMFEGKEVKHIAKNYGLVIVDECHHISASTFNQIMSDVNAKNVYGLTATPTRKDGHHPNIFMQCGSLRYEIDPKTEAFKRTFLHYVVPRFTAFRKPLHFEEKEWHISSVYSAVCGDYMRNNLIISDVISCIGEGRHPLVLTQRTEHVRILGEQLIEQNIDCVMLTGKLTNKERKEAFKKLDNRNEYQCIIATGRLIGEGFDLPNLDTLFMAMPVSWKGTIIQYAGRLHRESEGKEEVRIYDYVDVRIAVLENMYHKRMKGYKSIGYSIKVTDRPEIGESSFYSGSNAFKNIKNDFKNATEAIVISTMKIKLHNLMQWKESLKGIIARGVRVCIVTTDLSWDKNSEFKNLDDATREIMQCGVDMKIIENKCPKMIFIDEKIAWFGDLNMFGYNDGNSSAMRFIEDEVVNELLDVMEEVISNGQS